MIIHWLGEMFDPALAGYWGSADHMAAMQTAVAIINAHAAKVDGVKISLLDKEKEIVMRRQLAKGVRMYTGDDFNYAELIAGDEQGLQRRAARHLRRHRAGRLRRARARSPPATAARFDDILAPTVPLSRHIFKAPTRFYKTGVVFMAYLNGLQDHFVMVGGQQSARSIVHLAELFRLADRAGLLRDPDMARRRMVRGAGRARDRLMRELAGDLWHLSINTATVRKQLALPAIIEACVARGIGAVCPWRDQVQAAGLAAVARQVKDAGLAVSGYCRGGFFPAADAAGLRAALEDNRKAVDEAKTLGAACLVLVVGALPGALAGKPASKDIGLARARWSTASPPRWSTRSVGMPLAIEPLHPMQARRARLHQHAGARARHLRCARPRAHRRARRRARRLPLLVGPQAREPDRPRRRQAPARLPRLRLAGADARPPQRPRHDGRRHRRAAQGPRLGRGRRLHRRDRGRDLLRPLVEPPRRRGPRHLRRALQDGGVMSPGLVAGIRVGGR